jgi:NADPH:quinone reductase-like Zn-dependent oxidoreductase
MMMKAILCKTYGPPQKVLQLSDVEKPVAGEGQVLMKVHAASANISDFYGVSGLSRLFGGGILRPKDPTVGSDGAGEVEAIGTGVTRFRAGDQVFGSCQGSFAEFTLVREDRLAKIPAGTTFEEAAAVPIAGLTALQCLRDKGKVQGGQEVAVNGASGGVGTFAVQIAKSLGAQVTGVCSTRNLEQAQMIGADHVVDYTKMDFTREGRTYDLICDIVGNHSVGDYKKALKPGGSCLIIGFAGNPLFGLVKFWVLGKLGSTGDRKIGFLGIAKMKSEDLEYMGQLLAAGKVKPVIERRYELGETASALQYIGDKHTRGKVVITIS